MLGLSWRMLRRSALCAATLLSAANIGHAQTTIPMPVPINPAVQQNAPKDKSVDPVITPGSGSTFGLGLPSMPTNAPAAAPTSTSSIDELKARVERLEKQNLDLLNAMKDMHQRPAVQTVGAADAPLGPLAAQDVRTIINTYLGDDAKKAEAKTKDPWYEVGSDPSGKAKWAYNRLTFESPNKDFKAHLGGRLQFDNYSIGANQATLKGAAAGAYDDNNFFRRIRLEFDGQAYENFEWNFEVDLERNSSFAKNQAGATIANGNFPAARFDEMYIGLRNLPFVGNVRAGHIRVPQGLESSTSSRNLMFLERTSGFESFLQEFDPGILVFNTAMNDRLFWAAALHRIDVDSKMGDFGNGDVAFSARLAGLPIYENEGRTLLHVGASYQYHANPFNSTFGKRSFSYGAPGDWRASYFTPTLVSTGTFLSDHTNQFGLEALAIWGPFSIQAEYFGVQASNVTFPAAAKVASGARNFNSGYIAASYFLTGENRKYDKRHSRLDRLIPNENFFFVKGEDGSFQRGIGAWEVAARWDWIDLNDSPIAGGYMNNWTLGLNWYLNPSVKLQGNWTMTDRTVAGAPAGAGGPNSPLIHALGLRIQWEF